MLGGIPNVALRLGLTICLADSSRFSYGNQKLSRLICRLQYCLSIDDAAKVRRLGLALDLGRLDPQGPVAVDQGLVHLGLGWATGGQAQAHCLA